MPLYRLLQNVRILPISSLKLHEETQRELTEKIKRMVRGSHLIKNPIIVERGSHVVLDGTHRVKAFQELGYKNALCQLVDYSSPELKVGVWYPTFSSEDPEKALEGLVFAQPVPFTRGLQVLKASKALFLLVFLEKGKRKCILIGPSPKRLSTSELAADQRSFIKELSAKHRLRHIPDEGWEAYLSEGRAILLRRKFAKEEILSMARRGEVLPPKTTRHMLPIRVLHANVPVEWLKLGEKEAEGRLRKLLHHCLELEEARHYPEPVLVLDDARASQHV